MKRRSREQIVRSLLTPQKEAPAQAARAKAGAALRTHALGTPTRTLVSSSAARSYRRERLHPLAQPLPIALAAGVVGAAAMFFAAQGLLAMVTVAVFALVAGYGVTESAIGSAARRAAQAEIELAGAFDKLIASAAHELPEGALARLAHIKAQLARLLAEMPALRRGGTLASDDEQFVRQTVARYLPDALTPYFALPPERRTQGEPQKLLDEQLELVSVKLDSLVQRAEQAHVERLRRNRTFLDRKLG